MKISMEQKWEEKEEAVLTFPPQLEQCGSQFMGKFTENSLKDCFLNQTEIKEV